MRSPTATPVAVMLVLSLLCAACGTTLPDEAFTTAAQQAGGEVAGVPGSEAAGPEAVAPGGAPVAPGAEGGPAAGPAAAGQPGAPAPGGPAGPSDQGVSDTEILIGATGPLSGIGAVFGEEAFGAVDAYFQYVNAQGGLNGRKLRLITLDDRNDPTLRVANARRLVEQHKVFALVVNPSGDAVSDYVTAREIPTLVFGVTPPSFSSRYPTVYPIVGNALIWTQAFVEGLRQVGVMKDGLKVGIAYDTQLFDLRSYAPFIKESWENAGAKVVALEPFDIADGDCTALLFKMRNAGVEYWDLQTAGFSLCLAAGARQGWKPPAGWGGWPAGQEAFSSQVGPAIEGVWSGATGDQIDGKPRTAGEPHRTYQQAVSTYHPQLGTPGHLSSPVTVGYWVAAQMLVSALRAQGASVTKAGVNRWIQTVRDFDPGITPPIASMAPNCKTGSEQIWIAQWKWTGEQAERQPATGYLTSPQKERYGGECFLTALSDRLGG